MQRVFLCCESGFSSVGSLPTSKVNTFMKSFEQFKIHGGCWGVYSFARSSELTPASTAKETSAAQLHSTRIFHVSLLSAHVGIGHKDDKIKKRYVNLMAYNTYLCLVIDHTMETQFGPFDCEL